MAVSDAYYTVMADRIGRTLSELIQDNTSRLDFSFVGFDSLEMFAALNADDIGNRIPGVFIRPSASTFEPFDTTASLQDAEDTFRVVVVVDYDTQALTTCADKVRTVMEILRTNRTLPELDFSPHQMRDTSIGSVDWDPIENTFLRELGAHVWAAAVDVTVVWYTRNEP